jgi:hypothetical protein
MTGSEQPAELVHEVRGWLRAEGIAAFAGSALAFVALGADWPWFLVFLLLPDVSIAGYRWGPRVGAMTYNLAHNWATGGLITGLGLATDLVPVTLAGLILIAHTGMDRALGYGLKSPAAFSETHLGRIGRRH